MPALVLPGAGPKLSMHPRPDLHATDADPGSDFSHCWARLAEQWLLPTDPHTVVDELTVLDLRTVALELFNCGAGHQCGVVDHFRRVLGEDVAAPRPESEAIGRECREPGAGG